MGDVVTDNVWVGGEFIGKGTPRSALGAELAARVGAHLWGEAEPTATVGADGVALSGLADNVWVDGVMYQKGSMPPAALIPRIGSHLWVGGRPPHEDDTQSPSAPTSPWGSPPSGTEAPTDPAPDPVPPQIPRNVLTRGDDDLEPGPDAPAAPKPAVPPRRGKGSSAADWAAYALAYGVVVDDDAKQGEIVAQLDEASVPTE